MSKNPTVLQFGTQIRSLILQVYQSWPDPIAHAAAQQALKEIGDVLLLYKGRDTAALTVYGVADALATRGPLPELRFARPLSEPKPVADAAAVDQRLGELPQPNASAEPPDEAKAQPYFRFSRGTIVGQVEGLKIQFEEPPPPTIGRLWRNYFATVGAGFWLVLKVTWRTKHRIFITVGSGALFLLLLEVLSP